MLYRLSVVRPIGGRPIWHVEAREDDNFGGPWRRVFLAKTKRDAKQWIHDQKWSQK